MVGFLFLLILLFIGAYLFQLKRDDDKMKREITHLKDLRVREKSRYLSAVLNKILEDRGEEAVIDTEKIHSGRWFVSFINNNRISVDETVVEYDLFDTLNEYRIVQKEFTSGYRSLISNNREGFKKLLLEKKAGDVIYLNEIYKELSDERSDDI